MYNVNTAQNTWEYLQRQRTLMARRQAYARREFLLRNPDFLRQVVENQPEQPYNGISCDLIVWEECQSKTPLEASGEV